MEALPLDACASIMKLGEAIPSGSVTVNVPEIEVSSRPEPLISPEKTLGSSTAVTVIVLVAATELSNPSFTVQVMARFAVLGLIAFEF